MPEFQELAERAGELAIRIGISILVVILFAVAGRVTTPLVRRLLDRRKRPSYTRVFAGLYRVVVVIVGSLVALTLAFPSVRMADVLAIFGIISVAAGFAFKDTFENLLAGVLLLLRDPFQSGDQVEVADREGTVEGVTVRETLLRGYDGRHYFVPNAKVMTGIIEVATHEPFLRQSFLIRLDGVADLANARDVIVSTLSSLDSIRADPPPEAVAVDVVGTEVEFECRFWTGSRRSDATDARDRAITEVVGALRRNGVPFPTEELRVSIVPPAPGAGEPVDTAGTDARVR